MSNGAIQIQFDERRFNFEDIYFSRFGMEGYLEIPNICRSRRTHGGNFDSIFICIMDPWLNGKNPNNRIISPIGSSNALDNLSILNRIKSHGSIGASNGKQISG